jgi:hypothetical protein
MHEILTWLKARLETFAHLPDYGKATAKQWMNILFGETVLGVIFLVWWALENPKNPPLIVIFIAAVIVAGYFVWRADHLRLRQTLDITQALLQEWTDVASQQPAFAYYIEVVNTSEAVSILEAKVQLMEIVPEVQNLNWLPVLLRQKHDHKPPTDAEKLFDLHPGDKKHIDFVSALYGSNQFTIQHLVDGVNNQVNASQHHRLKVAVIARHTPAHYAWFEVWIDGKGVLQCKMEPKLKNSTQ